MNDFLCSACSELLNNPIILPCGNAVCKRCFRVKSAFYTCPAWNCRKTHQFRNEKPNTMLRQALETLFPIEVSVYKKVEFAEGYLTDYLSTVCNNDGSERELVSLQEIVNSLETCVEVCPHLQLLFIVKAKIYMEMHDFDKALLDANVAHRLNECNQRGLVLGKIVDWRRQKYLANLNILSICALSELSAEDTAGEDSPKQDLSSDLTSTLAELKQQLVLSRKNSSDACTPISCTYLNTSYTNLPGWGLSPTDFECRICWSVLNDPVSSPCGHSWCRECLIKSTEKSTDCPLCRSKLPSMGYFISRPKSILLDRVIAQAFGQSDVIKQSKTVRELPIFVCTLVFPHSKPSFHMFEPRYRVMIFN